MEKYYKRSEAEMVGNGHLNPDGTSYLPAEEWKLIKDAMNSGLDSKIFELELEIMKKEQELSLLKYVKENPEKFFRKEEFTYWSLQKPKSLMQILEVIDVISNQNKNYIEAVKIVAKERNIHESTVRANCTYVLDLDTNGFKELLKNKEEVIEKLVGKFPNKKGIINDKLSD